MRTPFLSSSRVAFGVLLSAALVACEGAEPVGIDPTAASSAVVLVPCTNVTLDAVYSGPPNRPDGVIDLNDQWVYVEVLDITRFALPGQQPSASDVRMGPSFADGTPAESYQILNINNDGKPDIRLRFSKFALVADGNLDQQTTQIQVWGLHRGPNKEYCGSRLSDVTLPPPAAGEDVVVFNDINIFDLNALAQSTENEVMIANLVTFTTTGSRNSGNVVMWDRGRNAVCGPSGNSECNDANMLSTRNVIVGEGFSIMDVASVSGSLTNIPANVKSIWLWTPRIAYTTAEINALKVFASQGGRIVFIGEWDGYYTQTGIAVENQFLASMGAQMTNTGGAVNCGYNFLPGTSIRNHQVTETVDNLTIACASVIIPGPQDFILYYDLGQTQVLAGVAKINTTPVATATKLAPVPQLNRVRSSRLNPASSTGR